MWIEFSNRLTNSDVIFFVKKFFDEHNNMFGILARCMDMDIYEKYVNEQDAINRYDEIKKMLIPQKTYTCEHSGITFPVRGNS